jgi:hypothetical protein
MRIQNFGNFSACEDLVGGGGLVWGPKEWTELRTNPEPRNLIQSNPKTHKSCGRRDTYPDLLGSKKTPNHPM